MMEELQKQCVYPIPIHIYGSQSSHLDDSSSLQLFCAKDYIK